MMQNSVPDVPLVPDEGRLPDVLSAATECGQSNIKGPPIPHPQHLSVVSLGTYVRRHGFTPVVLDNITRIPDSRRRFLQLLSDRVPVVGISTSLLVVLGGPTAEQEPEVAALADGNAALQGESAARIWGIWERIRGHLGRLYEGQAGVPA